MDKESKENKEMPEDPVDTTTGEEKIQDKAEEAVDKAKEEKEEETPQEESAEVKEPEPVDEDNLEDEPTDEEPVEEVKETTEPKSDKEPLEKSDEKPIKKPAQATDKKAKKPEEKKKEKKDHGPDFKYIVRLSNTDIDGEKNVIFGLTSIKGVGMAMASLIIRETKINQKTKMGDLKDSQIETLQKAIDAINNTAPRWMLNHRKDYETGKDIHLIGPEIELRLRDEINTMKKIRSYRGIRHERNLPCRGQRTRANNRTGLTLGVSKKRP